MSKQLVDFKEDHQVLLKSYLDFFSKKKDECFKQIQLSIEDTKYEQRNTKLFTAVDFEEIMSKLSSEMEEAVSSELTVFYRMSGVMIQMLMFDAEQKNATLQADVSQMESYKALEQMKDFENLKTLAAGTSAASAFTMAPIGGGMKKGAQLPTLGGAMMQQQMMNQMKESQQSDNLLKGESDKYKEQVKDLQAKITDLLTSKKKQTEGNSAADHQIVELENKLMMVEEERSQAIDA